MQSIDLIETYAYGPRKELVSDTKMSHFDDVVKENIKEHNPNWLQFSDHPYRTLIIGGSG